MTNKELATARRIDKARRQKAARYASAFDATITAGIDPLTPAYREALSDEGKCLEVIRQIEEATPEQWRKLAKDLNEDPPSKDTRQMLVDIYRRRIASVADARNEVDDVMEYFAEGRAAEAEAERHG